jgi:molecular chaperone DnaK
MSTVIGIDLGTTNTVVGVVKDGQASAIPDDSGQVLIPSVVSFHPTGNVLVGRAAKQRRLVDSANTIYSVKRLIGRSWDSEEVRRARSRFPFQMREGPGQAALVVARGETYTLPEISAFVLRKAKAVAEAALGSAVERAVITVPANFNDLQRAATKVAGRVAGLEVIRILNEPTAAALAYGYGRSSSERLAVYDFGGGTFDVTLLDLSDNVFEVLATAGNTFLGGDDIDLAIAERMADAFLSKHRFDPRSDPQIFEHLKVAAEDLKHRLSDQIDATVQLTDFAHGAGGKPLSLSFTLTRAELERLAAPLVDRTFEVCREALGIARLSVTDFQQILLVGGSTRIPLVRRRVEEFWKREVKSNISPDEVVAIGAAIQASALSGAERRRGTVPPPPNPARLSHGKLSDRPSALARRKPSTLPPGQRTRTDTAPGPGPMRARMDTQPDPFGIPSTQPFAGGRPHTPTKPGVQSGADPAAPARHPALGVLGKAQPADGGGERPRAKTGTGLGPTAPARVVSGPTLVSASDEAAQALARGDSAASSSPAASSPAPRQEESVAFVLGDADIQEVAPPPEPPAAPPPPGLRSLAQPMTAAAHDDDTTETDWDALALPDDEPTKVGSPSPADVERARQEGLAMLAALEAQSPAARLPVPASPPLASSSSAAHAGQRTAVMPVAAPSPPAQAQVAPLFAAPQPAQAQGAPLWVAPQQAQPEPAAFDTAPPFYGTLDLEVPAAPVRASAPWPAAAASMGAAAAGAQLLTTQPLPVPPSPAPLPAPPVLVDVTPLTLAVETVEGFCDSIITRNTAVPCARTREFVTAADNQTSVRVRVSQGESKRFMENTLLGEIELSGLRPARRGDVRIAVSFALDASGMLVVSAKDVGTGRETSTRVRLVGLPDAPDVARMAARQIART